jgi:hypothetical protein
MQVRIGEGWRTIAVLSAAWIVTLSIVFFIGYLLYSYMRHIADNYPHALFERKIQLCNETFELDTMALTTFPLNKYKDRDIKNIEKFMRCFAEACDTGRRMIGERKSQDRKMEEACAKQ